MTQARISTGPRNTRQFPFQRVAPRSQEDRNALEMHSFSGVDRDRDGSEKFAQPGWKGYTRGLFYRYLH